MSWSSAEVIRNNNIARYKVKHFENRTHSSLFKYLNDFLNALSIIPANKNYLADFFFNTSECLSLPLLHIIFNEICSDEVFISALTSVITQNHSTLALQDV